MAEKVARTRSNTTIAPEVLVVEAEPHSPPELAWRAGQFISIRCEKDVRRSYSISSLAQDGKLELLVKLIPNGAGSLYFEHLRPGDEIHFTGPMGFFVCDLQHAGDAVFAVTGSGIAAALPMIRETLARPNEQGRVLLYWGMRNAGELYWLDRLAALAHPRFTQHICMSQADEGWTGLRGRINGHVLAAAPALDRPIFYLVGNGNMVRELKQALIDAGMDRKKQIRQEIFYPATEK